MIGTDQADVRFTPDQRANPVFHLACRLIGKRHAQDIEGIDAVLLHEIGVTAHEQLRLATASPPRSP